MIYVSKIAESDKIMSIGRNSNSSDYYVEVNFRIKIETSVVNNIYIRG